MSSSNMPWPSGSATSAALFAISKGHMKYGANHDGGPLRFSAQIEPTLRTYSRYKLHLGAVVSMDGASCLPLGKAILQPANLNPSLQSCETDSNDNTQ